MNLTDTNEKLTAYLLEELDDEEKAEVEALLESDRKIKQTFEELKAAVSFAESALLEGDDSCLQLRDEQRAIIRQSAGDAVPTPDSEDADEEETAESSGLLDMRKLKAAVTDAKNEDAAPNDDRSDPMLGATTSFAPILAPPVKRTNQNLKRLLYVGVAASIVLVVILVVNTGTDEKEDERAAQIAALEQQINQLAAPIAEGSSNEAKQVKEDPASTKEPKKPQPRLTTDTRKKGKTKSSDTPDRSSPSANGTPKPKASGTSSELDDLLGGAVPKSKPKPKSSSKSGAEGKTIKSSLSRRDVQKGMNGVSSKVRACARGKSGSITVKAVIGKTGRVLSAAPTGVYAGTSAGNCAANAVKKARFPESDENLTVRYPFKLK